MNYRHYTDPFFDPLTRYFSKLIASASASIAKVNFFTLLCSIVLAVILSVNSYFSGLLVAVLLFFLATFMRSVEQIQAKLLDNTLLHTQHFNIFLCEAVLLLGLAIHCNQMNFSLVIGLLAVFGFVLTPILENELHTHFHILPFDLRMGFFILALILNLGILLLLFYALLLNGQMLCRLFRSAH